MEDIEVDLTKTGGRLLPPGLAPGGPDGAPPVPPAAPGAQTETPVIGHDHPPDARPANCRKCGWDSGIDPGEPTADQKQAFQAAVLRDEPYRERVELYGGAVVATLVVAPPEVDEAVRGRVAADAAGAAGALHSVEAMTKTLEHLTDYRVACGVESVLVGGRLVTPDSAVDDLAARHAAFRAAVGRAVYPAVRAEFIRFYSNYAVMVARAADRSFWPATPGSGPSSASPPPATRG